MDLNGFLTSKLSQADLKFSDYYKSTWVIFWNEILLGMVPYFLHIDANHVQKDLLMNSVDFIFYTVSVIALKILLVSRFDSDDEKLLEYFNKHLFKGFVTWSDIHFYYSMLLSPQL